MVRIIWRISKHWKRAKAKLFMLFSPILTGIFFKKKYCVLLVRMSSYWKTETDKTGFRILAKKGANNLHRCSQFSAVRIFSVAIKMNGLASETTLQLLNSRVSWTVEYCDTVGWVTAMLFSLWEILHPQSLNVLLCEIFRGSGLTWSGFWKNKPVKLNKKTVAGRAPRYTPAPLLPPWAPKRLAPLSRRQRSNSFPRPTRSHAHCCSRLTRQYGGEQSGLMTLTFDLLTLKVVSESRVTWATFLYQFWSSWASLHVLDLGPMYATDRRQTQTDRRQTASSLNAPAYLGRGIIIIIIIITDWFSRATAVRWRNQDCCSTQTRMQSVRAPYMCMRHLNDIIWRAMKRAQIPAIKEPVGLMRQDGKRPDGTTILPWPRGRPLAWDVTVPDTYADAHVVNTAGEAIYPAIDPKR